MTTEVQTCKTFTPEEFDVWWKRQQRREESVRIVSAMPIAFEKLSSGDLVLKKFMLFYNDIYH